MIIDWGVQEAKKEGVPAYLESVPGAKSLYEKYGFKQVGELSIDLRASAPRPRMTQTKPARWLDGDEPDTEDKIAAKKLMQSAFSPISIGSRACTGKAMAYMKISITMAKTLWYFDFQRLEGKVDQVEAGIEGKKSGRERSAEF
ncbi:MAG: hypothetical protein M1820_009009 [Bogoriella megaspora]|nr:MAG: hypothetical protein M1820_009009 [Bogoriella megaspora]